MNEPWLDEQHTWQGHWWLPDEPDDAVAGVLTYEPSGGLTLDLIGGFEGMISEEVRPGAYTVRDESGTWPVVHGVAANKEVTLLDCVPTRTMSRNFGASEAQTIRPRAALVGVHLDQPQQAAFNECHISVEDRGCPGSRRS